MREFLEKNYTDESIASDNDAIKLAIKALLEVINRCKPEACFFFPFIFFFSYCVYHNLNDVTQVVQSGGKNIELAVIRRNQPLKVIYTSFLVSAIKHGLMHVQIYVLVAW